ALPADHQIRVLAVALALFDRPVAGDDHLHDAFRHPLRERGDRGVQLVQRVGPAVSLLRGGGSGREDDRSDRGSDMSYGSCHCHLFLWRGACTSAGLIRKTRWKWRIYGAEMTSFPC